MDNVEFTIIFVIVVGTDTLICLGEKLKDSADKAERSSGAGTAERSPVDT